ncbi:serine/threonine-protein kinase [Spirillospora sp. NPDC047279]|uniref:serine/threonine-protein kinase n=1 Tax=Spirillospora sp. NPDC047279 TaxID=3155478 RepID=UPI003401BB6A
MVAVLRDGDPHRIGGYELAGRLGEGGQGAVFLGREPGGGVQVAIKLLHAELNDNERARGRFLREFEVAMRVAPFCTAQVLDASVEDGRPYIVSEYVPGPSLHHQVSTEGPLTGGALQRVAVGTVTALVAIHQAGVVHRDFKPGNVLLGPAGARVIDFGIARALDATTKTGGMVGTPVYMAPEQVRGERAGPPIDVFAWGATIGFAASGRAPFGADTLPAVINRVLNGEPDLAGLDGRLREIVERCLVKDASRRPEARDILMFLLGQPESAPASAPAPSPAPAPHQTQTSAMPAAASAPPPVPAPMPDSEMTGILQAGHDLAAQRTPESTLPPGVPPQAAPLPAPMPPPAAFHQPAPIQHQPAPIQQQPAAFHQPAPAARHQPTPLQHQITIDPFAQQPLQPAKKRPGKVVLWAASATVAAALLTGLVLLAPHFQRDAQGKMTDQHTPLPTATTSQTQETSQTTPTTSTPTRSTPTETSGGYTEPPTPTPSWTPSWTPTPTPTGHSPTPDPTPTHTSTSDPCDGDYPPSGCSGGGTDGGGGGGY